MSQQHYVNYTINGKDFQVGPYSSQPEADLHYRDIRGYVGVTNCWIGNSRDQNRLRPGDGQ
ncbi:hypothetical protein [Bradyrhizobium sp. th.b2]|uniref:hypothetical protein n=1 Tax=Bradyrhizobium sp. th-b2 TaxID=172088 RepID=UPI0004017CC1|nr:hypothetical protein [Bradyrhizobium sp. th.b2]